MRLLSGPQPNIKLSHAHLRPLPLELSRALLLVLLLEYLHDKVILVVLGTFLWSIEVLWCIL